jgi:hypothetical protein
MPATFFFGSLTLLNLIVSTLCTYPALNLKQKAEKTLIPFPRAGQLPKPTNDFRCRESFLVNFEFWEVASFVLHTSSRAFNFVLDSHTSCYNFGTWMEW